MRLEAAHRTVVMLLTPKKRARFSRKAHEFATTLFYSAPVSKHLHPRQTQVYCVGTAKSGTTSLATLFKGQLRTFHEADCKEAINLILDLAEGRATRGALRSFLVARDRRLQLDLDSSQLNYFFLTDLLGLFPAAKFILTLRDPYSWLDSLINHQLGRRSVPPEWRRLRDYRFGGGRPHPAEERALEARGLYTLDGYLAYWAKHNTDVLQHVPAERLLVVRTDQITPQAEAIGHFIGVPQTVEKAERTRANEAWVKLGVLAELEPNYLEAKVQAHCGELVHRFFPEGVALQPGRPASAATPTGLQPQAY